MGNHDYTIPNDDTLSSDDIHPGTNLTAADLSGADLRGADLSKAILRGADLSKAYVFAPGDRLVPSEVDIGNADLSREDLPSVNLSEADLGNAILSEVGLAGADLTRADLSEADLSGADLGKADLSGADLSEADLSGADLGEADLSGADLRGANLSEAFLAETSFNDVILSRGTDIDPPSEQIQYSAERIILNKHESRLYDSIARSNHKLRKAYSRNGLISQARRTRFRERKARRKEAKAEGGWGTVAWVGSVLSQLFTGYGVRLRWVAGSMLALYLGSSLVYWQWGEMWWGRSLYYSVVTFTTAPPERPPAGITSIVAGIETFAGTAAIVFLGYVLGTRERV